MSYLLARQGRLKDFLMFVAQDTNRQGADDMVCLKHSLLSLDLDPDLFITPVNILHHLLVLNVLSSKLLDHLISNAAHPVFDDDVSARDVLGLLIKLEA